MGLLLHPMAQVQLSHYTLRTYVCTWDESVPPLCQG